MESAVTLNDELQHLFRESRVKHNLMFNAQYARLIYARVGNIRYSHAGETGSKEFLRVLYEAPRLPRMYIDIHQDIVRLTICEYKGNNLSTEEFVFSYSDYEEFLFQQSTIYNLYTFDSETMAICKDLSIQFYNYIDIRDKI